MGQIVITMFQKIWVSSVTKHIDDLYFNIANDTTLTALMITNIKRKPITLCPCSDLQT